jgi:TonB family protein
MLQSIGVRHAASQVSEDMLELKTRPTLDGAKVQGSFASRQRGKLAVAFVLLVVALAVIVVRDHDFWFGSDEADSDVVGPEVASQKATTKPAPSAVASTPLATPATAPAAKKHVAAAPAASVPAKPAVAELAKPAEASKPATSGPASSGVVASNRVVLPPLDVEVVAGDSHRTIHPGSAAEKVDILKPGSTAVSNMGITTNAAERERVFTGTFPVQQGTSITATYPLLAKQMRVRGSVILQAVIGADGAITNLKVVSGPAILASAAQAAVREWRFKPYLQNGQPVETKAQITVNFTIKVGDTATTLAESLPDDTQVVNASR